MASVSKLSNGRWRARWREYAGGPQRARHFDTLKEANSFLVAVQHDLARGVYVTPEDAAVTFPEYVEVYLSRQIWRRATRANGERALARAAAHWGDRPLASIRRADVQAYVASLSLAPSSVQTEMKYVRGLFRMAVLDRVVGRDESAGVKLPRITSGRIDPLSRAEVDALEAAAPEWFRVAIVLGATLGIRQSELRALTIDRVRFLTREIRISCQADRHAETFGDTKTVNSVRTVPVDSSVLDEIAATGIRSGYVLGRYATTSTFGNAFRATRERAGIDSKWRFHDLRHYAASEMLGAGLSVPAVAAILGDTPTTVLRTYAHFVASDEDKVRLVQRALRTPEDSLRTPRAIDGL